MCCAMIRCSMQFIYDLLFYCTLYYYALLLFIVCLSMCVRVCVCGWVLPSTGPSAACVNVCVRGRKKEVPRDTLRFTVRLLGVGMYTTWLLVVICVNYFFEF